MKLRILEFGELRMSPNKIWAGLSTVTELATAGSNVPQGIVKLGEYVNDVEFNDISNIRFITAAGSGEFWTMDNGANSVSIYGARSDRSRYIQGINWEPWVIEVSCVAYNGSIIAHILEGGAISGVAMNTGVFIFADHGFDINARSIEFRNVSGKVVVYGFA